MPDSCDRKPLLPVVALLLASGCIPSSRKDLDKLNYQVRSQQHVIAGQARKIDELTRERDALQNQLADQDVLISTYQVQTADSEKARELASQELENLRHRLEELARQDPDAFEWNASAGTLGVAAEVLFRPGKADLLPTGAEALRKVTPLLRESRELIRVDGHTDADPIRLSKWDDNWQLAGERARRVLKFLEAEGIPRERLFFAGFADTRPKADNTSAAGKKVNRRVELLPLPAADAAPPTAEVSLSPGK
ncbi:MAG: OmpA family protein [Planctomycetes bacterium]|nr:OmpA family protein [Planctomycetota bacterium]